MIAKFIDRPCEDSLTAAVFGHLLHLPMEQCWQILRDACPSSQFPEFPGEPLAIHPWPCWSAEGTDNTDRVIPDLFIAFETFDLIVEAKRWDVPMQSKKQWKRELKAYLTEYGSKKRAVKMLALGGVHTLQDDLLPEVWNPGGPDEHIFKCPVFMCPWSRVLLVCQGRSQQLKQKFRSSRTNAEIRILKDLAALFIRHGIAPLRWFEDFSFSSNLLSSSADSEQKQFRETSRQLRQA